MYAFDKSKLEVNLNLISLVMFFLS